MKTTTVLLFALFSLAASAILHFNTMFIMALALIAVPFLSYIVGRISIRDLVYKREAPEYIHEDDMVPVTVRITGKANYLGSADLDDQLPEWLEKIDYSVHDLPPDNRNEVAITYTAQAKKRGAYNIGPLQLTLSDPLGFYRFQVSKPLYSRLVVFPRPLLIPGLRITPIGRIGEHQFEGVGTKGSGIDFHSVREYHPGDELRRVHWPSTARHGKLNVMEFEHTKVEDAIIAIDLERGSEKGSGRYTTLEYAISIAASVSEQALAMGSMVRLLCQGQDDASARPGKGVEHWYTILEALAGMEANHSESLADIIAEQIDSLPYNSAFVCLGSSISAKISACAQMLMDRNVKFQYILVTLSDKLSAEDEYAVALLASTGASVTVVECSTAMIEGRVKYEYTSQ